MKPFNTNNITLRPVEEIKPNPRNARAHSDEQIAQIMQSFEQVGITHPILTDEDGMILAGHGKWLAAKKMNLPEVPVLVVPGLTEKEKQLYLIADNQIALNSTWDQEKLTRAGYAESEISTLEPRQLRATRAASARSSSAVSRDWSCCGALTASSVVKIVRAGASNSKPIKAPTCPQARQAGRFCRQTRCQFPR